MRIISKKQFRKNILDEASKIYKLEGYKIYQSFKVQHPNNFEKNLNRKWKKYIEKYLQTKLKIKVRCTFKKTKNEEFFILIEQATNPYIHRILLANYLDEIYNDVKKSFIT